MQLTRTNAVFSRIALVSCFCAESQVSGKFPKNIPEFLFSRRHTEPEDETEAGHEGPTPWASAAEAGPRRGVVWPPRAPPRVLLSTT